jgi:hypothetical protein
MRSALLALAIVALARNTPLRAQNVSPTPAQAAQSRAAFARLKKLAGKWQGKSTKGWTEKIEYEVIAGGSVLMERSIGAHPTEWMATMFHLDGDRLLLTHYCIAKNQPRLVATKITEDLSQITFEFLDGTGLKNRDQGHMDKVVMKLHGPDRFTSQWTWYQDGKESWMEEIENRRGAAAPARKTPKLQRALACHPH